MDRNTAGSGLPGFWEMLERGEENNRYMDYPDVVPKSDVSKYPPTHWDSEDQECWTDWVELEKTHGFQVRTYRQKQDNAPIMLQTLNYHDGAVVVLNYHQFIKLWHLITLVGLQRLHNGSRFIEKLTGRDRLHVTTSPDGLMVDRVFMSFELCQQLCKVGSEPWIKLLNFFKHDVQRYPKYTPGFLL